MTDMVRLATIVAVLGALVAAVTASAGTGINGTDRANAARACTALRSASVSTFTTQYASFGACTTQWVKTAHTARLAAQSACRAKHLTGHAYATCVKTATGKTLASQVNVAKNAAKACAAQLKTMGPQPFESHYGANGNLRNAFGKCVSAIASGKSTGGGGSTTQTQHYAVTLSQLNGSNVSGSGSLLQNGNKLQVKLTLSGLETGQSHQIAIRGLSSGSAACPTASADTNSDGTISLSEGTTVFGGVLLGLDAATLTTTGWSTTVQSSLAPLQTRTVVVLGKTVNGTYDATLPVACGTITLK
jgi:hypothetical protein